MYKCVIKNESGEINANLSLQIEGEQAKEGESPNFVDKPTITSERDGKLILMECLVRANPKPEIVWFREGTRVSESTRIRQSIRNEEKDVYRTILEIHEPDIHDTGLYRCHVKNSVGEATANLNLKIEG